MYVSVVIAAYNEERNIGPLTERLIRTLESMSGARWELIYIIDGTDESVTVAQRFAQRWPAIRILHQPEPRGLGHAFRRGFAAVSPESTLVVTLDADLNHQPEEIPRLVAAIESRHADLVVGSRKVGGSMIEGFPAWKRALSGSVTWLMRRVMNVPIRDLTSGFRVYRADVVRRFTFVNDGFAFLPEILIWAHKAQYRIVEEPILFTARTEGRSKMRILPTAASYVSFFLRR
jgi:dolichol-phosphate mannosyltransferase